VAQCTVAVLLRILLVWVYLRSERALSTAVVVHASMNVTAAAALLGYGSHYDPTVTAAVQGCWSRSRM
jgi:hypothetical protein